MSVSLRDFFAAHVAAALVSKGSSPADAAKHAYDTAEALLEEGRFRAEAAWLAEPPMDEGEGWDDFGDEPIDAERFDRPHLLEEPIPPMDEEDNGDVFDPGWEDLADRPDWEREPRLSERPAPRPGLARTQGGQLELPLAGRRNKSA